MTCPGCRADIDNLMMIAPNEFVMDTMVSAPLMLAHSAVVSENVGPSHPGTVEEGALAFPDFLLVST